jgi:uncharacterized membrane protein
MNGRRLPLAVLVLTHLGLAVSLLYASQKLPDPVASHFNGQGVPDGWMSRSAHLWAMTGIGFGLSLFMLATFYSIRFFPNCTINLPHRDYWLAPERRTETCDAIFHAGLWFTSLLAAFLAAINLLVVAANDVQPVKLSSAIWLLLAALLATTSWWAYKLLRRFRIPD